MINANPQHDNNTIPKIRPSHWVHDTTISSGIYLPKEMFRSKAFSTLNSNAKQILLEFYCRLSLEKIPSKLRGRRGDAYFAKNNGQLILTYKQLERMYGYKPQSIVRAIDMLIDHGFIEVAVQGVGVKRETTKYALITNWKQFGQEGFKPGRPRAKGTVGPGLKKQKQLTKCEL